MTTSDGSSSIRQLLLYFGLMSLLVNTVNPGFLLDIPTSYMLKNILHASPSQISLFRLLSAIPFYLGFAFGMIRDLWNPFGQRDRGYFRIFVPIMICVLALMALSRTTYLSLLIGMLLTSIAYSFVFAAFQGLTALIGQEALMTGRLSSLSNIFVFVTASTAYFASGVMSERLSPHQIFFMVLALAATLGVFGFWKPRAVFTHTYDSPRAKGTDFFGDVRRLLKHRAIYPVVLINLLWSVIIGVPQFIPMAFIHTGDQALVAAVFIGLMGGLANVACIDIAMRACPPGLQGTMMMIIASTFPLSMRGGDVLGSWLYGLSPTYGFQYCVMGITVSYALILLVIPFIPRELTATADGEPNLADEALVLEEISNAGEPA